MLFRPSSEEKISFPKSIVDSLYLGVSENKDNIVPVYCTLEGLFEKDAIDFSQCYIPSVFDKRKSQRGPNCLCYALEKAIHFPARKDKNNDNYPTSLRAQAKKMGLTMVGGVFRRQDIEKLTTELKLPGKNIEVDSKSETAYTKSLCDAIKAHNMLIVSVDLDQNNGLPGKKKGYGAHWVLVVGFFVMKNAPYECFFIVSDNTHYSLWSAKRLFNSNAALPKENPFAHLYYHKKKSKIKSRKHFPIDADIQKITDEATLDHFKFSVFAIPSHSPWIISNQQLQFINQYYFPLIRMIKDERNIEKIKLKFADAQQKLKEYNDPMFTDGLLSNAIMNKNVEAMIFLIREGGNIDEKIFNGFIQDLKISQQFEPVLIVLSRLKNIILNAIIPMNKLGELQIIFQNFPQLLKDKFIKKSFRAKQHELKETLSFDPTMPALLETVKKDIRLLIQGWLREEKSPRRIAFIQHLERSIEKASSITEIDNKMDKFRMLDQTMSIEQEKRRNLK